MKKGFLLGAGRGAKSPAAKSRKASQSGPSQEEATAPPPVGAPTIGAERKVNQTTTGPRSDLSLEKRREGAEYIMDMLLVYMREDVFPPEHEERIYGIRACAGPGESTQMAVSDALGETNGMWLGEVVLSAWRTLYLHNQLQKEEFVDAILDNQLPELFQKKIENNGRPLSYYSKALIDGNAFSKIDWDRVVLHRLGSPPASALILAKNSINSSVNPADFKSHLRLPPAVLCNCVRESPHESQMVVEERAHNMEEVFRKMGVSVAREVPFWDKQYEGSRLHDYLASIFGPNATMQKQMWWLQNCGLCAAPDDVLRGEELCVAHDSVEKIVRLLK
ncbi:unnamed protein product [Amoebophrya sp. A120]|nr:unnamed protein product [Amoebophrya sp. A120]|eukprot:GSA120T00017647001.1